MKRMMLVCVMILCLLPITTFAEETFAPQGDYCVFCADGLYGVQTLDGETVVPAEYIGIHPIYNDLCIVEAIGSPYHPLLGLWRLSTREELQPCIWNTITVTDTLVVLNNEDDLMYLYDPYSNRIILSSNWILPLGNGKRFVTESEADDSSDGEIVDYCYQFRAPDGTIVFEVEVADGFLMDNPAINTDYALISSSPDSTMSVMSMYNFITGKQIMTTDFQCFWPVDGYAAAWSDQTHYYIIDCNGNQVSPFYLDIAMTVYTPEYGDGLFAVKKEDGWYIIRVDSEINPDELFGPIQCYGKPYYLGNQLFALPTEKGTLFFSALNNQHLFLEDTWTGGSMRASTTICKEGRYGFLFEDLTIIEPLYDSCCGFLGDFGFVKIGGVWHPIDREGNVDEGISYSYVNQSTDGLYYYVWCENGETYCLDLMLQPITHISVMAVG